MINMITRSHTSNALIVPKLKHISSKITFLVRAANSWNDLPPLIRADIDNMSLHLFKSCVFDSPIVIMALRNYV